MIDYEYKLLEGKSLIYFASKTNMKKKNTRVKLTF